MDDVGRLPRGNQERLLVVDDDPVLRDFFSEALRRCGYQVTLAAEGRTALETYGTAMAAGSPFDLVLMDVRMPGMDGGTCALSLQRVHAEARILLMSGNRDLDLGGLPQRLLGVMAKPFGLGELLRAVHNGVRGRPVARRHPALAQPAEGP